MRIRLSSSTRHAIGTRRRSGVGVALLAGMIAVFSGLTLAPVQAATASWMDTTQSPAQRAAVLLGAMTLDDKINMLHNQANCQYAGCTPTSFSGGTLPALHLQDGPLGVGDGVTGVTQLPAPVAAAASWDTALTRDYGTVLGQEHWGKGVNVVLGPTVNIVRDPRWGRAFESFGEDPYLTGQIAAADINGIQAQGPLAQIKHYAAYNQETNRNSTADNVQVSERALREIYTPAFETAINQAHVASVMCSYSVINGQFACENNHTQNEILKRDMGFQGFITADWGATHSTVASANNGLDMEMPDTNLYYGDALKNAVANGQVSVATIDDHVRRILTQMFTFGLFDKTQTGNKGSAVTSAAHNETAKQVAAQGSVLLKNSSILPLSNSGTIAVIGDDAGSGALYQGGGSAGVNSSYHVAPYDGIKARAGGATVNYYTNDQTSAVAGAKAANVAIVFVNKWQSEGSDTGDIDLGATQNNLVSAVAAANPNTIVVLNTGSAVTMPWVNNVKGVLEAWYPGQENGNAIAALLFGDINPSGKLPVTFPTNLGDVPANTAAQWPGTNGQVQYSEGVDVGYRSYDSRSVAPLFPFGFGLSYTTFGYSGLTVGQPDGAGNVAVSFRVTNTGTRTGAEVPQVYVSAPAGVGEPPKSLKGFSKVSLAAGASATVNLTLPARAFQYWGTSGWTTPAGAQTISVGASSRDIRLTGSVTLNGTTAPARSAYTTIQAENYDAQTGSTSLETTTDNGGGQDVGYINNGASLRFDNVDFGATAGSSVTARVASGVAGTPAGTIEVHLDALTNPAAATIAVNGTGGWQNWASVDAALASTTGKHTVFLKFVSAGTADFVNLNWLVFGQGNTTTPPPAGETPLNRTGWIASASSSAGADVPARAIDQNTATRWSTGASMTNGQTFTLDLGSAQKFDQVTVDAGGSTGDYPRGVTVQVSTDGTSWTPVTSATGTSAKVTVSFAAQTARYLRLVQTGSSSSWWSIAELDVLTAGTTTTTPPAGTPIALARNGWVAAANPSSCDVPANALDGNSATRFSSGTAMTNGQTFTLDLGTARTFDQVTMDSGGSTLDYARSFTVQTSGDGATWTDVTTGSGSAAVVTSRFANQTARWVRIVQTGSNNSWWSMSEFNLYAG